MRKMLLALLYTAFWVFANPVASMAEGEMERLIIHPEPQALPEAILLNGLEAEVALSTFKGKWLVLNFWATWCAPCREEMPSLLALQQARPDWAILPIATGRNPMPQITRFYEEAGVTALPILRDPTSALSSQMAVMGLPVTVIVNAEGFEVARLIGGADWSAPTTLTALDALAAD
jgi:thiol-disulfide isomerase/thioredoxin